MTRWRCISWLGLVSKQLEKKIVIASIYQGLNPEKSGDDA